METSYESAEARVRAIGGTAAQALSRRDGAVVQPAQAMAANLLRLSE